MLLAHGKQVSNPAQVKPGPEARLQAPQGLRWPLLLQVPNQAGWIRPHNLRLFTLSASCIQTSLGNENTAVTLMASARIKHRPQIKMIYIIITSQCYLSSRSSPYMPACFLVGKGTTKKQAGEAEGGRRLRETKQKSAVFHPDNKVKSL